MDLVIPATSVFCMGYTQAFSCGILLPLQRKTDEESPVKDADAKQSKQEATVNGSGDSSANNGKGVQEKEASDRLFM